MTAEPHFHARLAATGEVFEAPAVLTLLEAAELAGVPLPSSCRNGTCRTCLRPLLGGEVRYAVAWPGLLPEERDGHWVLPCVAHPLTDVVI